jgi:hypothetical protein
MLWLQQASSTAILRCIWQPKQVFVVCNCGVQLLTNLHTTRQSGLFDVLVRTAAAVRAAVAAAAAAALTATLVHLQQRLGVLGDVAVEATAQALVRGDSNSDGLGWVDACSADR